MRKVIGITIAVFMLAGSLVGCGNSDTEKSKTATVTSIETQAEIEETVETTTKEQSAKFSGNPEAQTMDHILHFYADGVTSFDYSGTPAEMGTEPESKQPYSAYVDISVNGDTGKLYAARYMIGVSEEDADTAAALADALFEQYDNGSGEQKSEHGYLIPNCEAFNGNLIIYYGANTDKTQNAFIFRIYNEDYNNAPDFYQDGNLKDNN